VTVTRPATLADLSELAALQARWETAWLGGVESDADEVRETLEPCIPLAGHSRLVLDGPSIVGAAWWHGHESSFLVDPAVDAGPAGAVLLDWLATTDVDHLDVLGEDTALQATLTARGWRHDRSAFDLIRAVTPDWVLDEPRWDDGIEVRPSEPDDAAAMHRLLYVDAGWADIAGHPHRSFDEWRSLFVTPADKPEQQVLAWRGERLVGVATGRLFSDGGGWIAQLAVARNERGHGLGRALLLEGLRRRQAAGATSLGLSVQATNRAALALYLSVGLGIEREWMNFVPPRAR
jgi:ribosomal protein S18 acetylase RimI-like enzyme